MNIVNNSNKISTVINLQNSTDVISRYGCMYTMFILCTYTSSHVYRSWRYKFLGHVIPSHVKWVVAEWIWRWTCNLEAARCWWFKSYRWQDFFVHLFRVPRSWTGSVQMKSSMTFIRDNRSIEREKDNFKSRGVKRLKECALELMYQLFVLL